MKTMVETLFPYLYWCEHCKTVHTEFVGAESREQFEAVRPLLETNHALDNAFDLSQAMLKRLRATQKPIKMPSSISIEDLFMGGKDG